MTQASEAFSPKLGICLASNNRLGPGLSSCASPKPFNSIPEVGGKMWQKSGPGQKDQSFRGLPRKRTLSFRALHKPFRGIPFWHSKAKLHGKLDRGSPEWWCSFPLNLIGRVRDASGKLSHRRVKATCHEHVSMKLLWAFRSTLGAKRGKLEGACFVDGRLAHSKHPHSPKAFRR